MAQTYQVIFNWTKEQVIQFAKKHLSPQEAQILIKGMNTPAGATANLMQANNSLNEYYAKNTICNSAILRKEIINENRR